MNRIFVGIDIGCENHCIHVMNESHEPLFRRTLKQSIREISKFIDELKALNFGEVLVGMEGSGGYASPLDRMLADAGFKVVAINPRALDQFRKLIGQERKDDPYDAYLICKYLIDIYQGQGREKNAQTIDKPGKSSLGNLRILTRQLRTTKRDLTRTIHRLKLRPGLLSGLLRGLSGPENLDRQDLIKILWIYQQDQKNPGKDDCQRQTQLQKKDRTQGGRQIKGLGVRDPLR